MGGVKRIAIRRKTDLKKWGAAFSTGKRRGPWNEKIKKVHISRRKEGENPCAPKVDVDSPGKERVSCGKMFGKNPSCFPNAPRLEFIERGRFTLVAEQRRVSWALERGSISGRGKEKDTVRQKGLGCAAKKEK